MASPELTEYERQRLENIRRREEMMASLNIHAKVQQLSASCKRHRIIAKNTAARKKSKTETLLPTRRSLRVRGKEPVDYTADAQKAEERLGPRRSLRWLRGSGLNHSEKVGLHESDPSSGENPSSRCLGPLKLRDAYTGSGSDRALVEAILSASKKFKSSPGTQKNFEDLGFEKPSLGAPAEGKKSARGQIETKTELRDDVKPKMVAFNERNGLLKKGSDRRVLGSLDLESLTLEEENVARAVSNRIFIVRFFPTADMNMVLVGNKLGDLGFWDIDSKGEDGDGIYSYHPHSAPISGISVQPYSLSKICTSSYDGCIRIMDAGKESFVLVYSSEDGIFSLSQRPDDISCFYFSNGYGGLNSYDERTRTVSKPWMLHQSRINTIDFCVDNPNFMATSSTDGTVGIWDLRRINADKPKALKIANFKRAVHSAYFSPSGKILATTSVDDRVGLFSGANFEHVDFIHHNNQTGRWISPFRGIWGWDDSYIFIGNMKRGVDVISSIQKKTIRTLESPYVSAIPCRFDRHPYQVGMLAGATGGGQVYVWTSC